MGTELLDLLGVDPDDPRMQDALADAEAAERLMDTLVRIREESGLTQSAVAWAMETTQSAVSKFERAGGDPHLSTIQRYARAVGAQVRFGVVVNQSGSSAWEAHYRMSATAPQDLDEVDSGLEIEPVISLAS